MRTRTLVLVAAGAAGVVSALGQPPPKADAPVEQVRTIPIDSCYATNGVSGGKHISDGSEEPYALDLGELIRGNRSGASNVALVRGKDIAGAVRATRWTFATSYGADAPVRPDPGNTNEEPLPFWLVAYFGAGPSHPGFGQVQSAEVRGHTVRVVFRRAQANKMTKDVCRYYIWVPLGQAETGTYALELFDADRKQVTLLRRVTVAER